MPSVKYYYEKTNKSGRWSLPSTRHPPYANSIQVSDLRYTSAEAQARWRKDCRDLCGI